MYNYYLKLLSVGGVSNPEDRIKVLVPESNKHFPDHYSLSRLCLFSPKLLKKIKAQIRGRVRYFRACCGLHILIEVVYKYRVFNTSSFLFHSLHILFLENWDQKICNWQ